MKQKNIEITTSTKFDKPSLEKPHHVDSNGTQKIWRFKNGFGASVVQFDGSYGNRLNDWELAIIKFDKEGDYRITYDTKITSDVIGYLSLKEVEKLLVKIKAIKGETK